MIISSQQYVRKLPDNIVADGSLTIHDNVVINPFVTILCKKDIVIGEGTHIGAGAVIVDHDHELDPPMESIGRVGAIEPVKIGRYCWIGANAVILKGVTLSDGCVV